MVFVKERENMYSRSIVYMLGSHCRQLDRYRDISISPRCQASYTRSLVPAKCNISKVFPGTALAIKAQIIGSKTAFV